MVLATSGTALAATDAIPGDPFRLGQQNRISTEPTSLAGTDQNGRAVLGVTKVSGAPGPAVRIENAAAGVAQPGLLIRTRPGQSPIQVNGDSGKANGSTPTSSTAATRRTSSRATCTATPPVRHRRHRDLSRRQRRQS